MLIRNYILSFNSVIMSHPADCPCIFPFELIFFISSASYVCAASCTRGWPSLSLPTAASDQSGIASRSRSRSNPCTSSPVPSCRASRPSPVSPDAVGSSVRRQVLKTHRQGACSSSVDARGYPHIAEQLVVEIPIQLFHQFRTAQSRVHFQEHQRNLSLRRKIRPVSSLHSHALPCQP